MRVTPEIIKIVEEHSDSAENFISSLFNDLQNEEKLFKPSHPQIQVINSPYKVTYVCLHRRAGKCADENTRVVHPHTLRPTPIKDCPKNTTAYTFDFDTNTVEAVDGEVILNPEEKKCLNLKFDTGTSIVLSLDHMIFKRGFGWVRTDSLKKGDKILSPNTLPIYGDKEYEEILGSTLMKEIEDTQRFPDEVFQYTKKGLKKFLKDLFNERGRYFESQKFIRIYLDNKELALDLHHLLLRIGVTGIINVDNDIVICDEIDQTLFLNQIGFDIEILDVKSPRRWVTVTDINQAGFRKVYDLGVVHPDHNFVANDIIIHNSVILAALAIYHAIMHAGAKILILAPADSQRKGIFSYIDRFIDKSPIISRFKAAHGNSNDSPTIRTFTNGSVITGRITGTTDNKAVRDAIRGETADYVFIDESQLLDSEDWKSINPIIRGDLYRRRSGHMRTYIFGTINEATGAFYKAVYEKKYKVNSKVGVVFVPITKNKEYTKKEIEEIREEETDYIFKTEYLLEPSTASDAVFRGEDIEYARKHDYPYGPHLIKTGRFRFLTVDWDKFGAPTSILVTQVNPVDESFEIIHREFVENSKFTYQIAIGRIFALYDEYSIHEVLIDKGAGENQFEQIAWQSEHSMNTLHEHLHQVCMKKKLKFPDPTAENGVSEKPTKNYMVELTKQVFQSRKFKFPSSDELIGGQLLQYKVVSENDDGTKKYSKKNEHFVDCICFAVLGWDKCKSHLVINQFDHPTTIMIDTKDSHEMVGDNTTVDSVIVSRGTRYIPERTMF